MKKNPVIIGLSVIIILIGAFLLQKYLTNPQTKIYQQTSKRAKEYIKGQKTKQNPDWAYVDLDGQNNKKENQVLGKQTLLVNHCYQMDIVFPIKFIREDKELCHRYISLREPTGGKIIIYQNNGSPNRLDDVPGVNFRRLEGEEYNEYEEKSLIINKHEFLTFKKTESSYERTAFVFHNEKLFIINLLTFSSQNLDNEYEQMLKSIKFFD